MPTLNIRLTLDQADRLKREATELGITRGSLIKERTFGGIEIVRRPRPDEIELRRLVGEIGKLGNNVNQIAKKVNKGSDIGHLRNLNRVQINLDIMSSALLDALGVDWKKYR